MKDLTQGSVTKHLLQMTAFLAISMLVQTLYLLADLYWGGASRQGSDRGGWCGRQFHDDSVGADANARCWHNHAHLASGRTKRSTSSRARLQPILRHVINCGGSVGHL